MDVALVSSQSLTEPDHDAAPLAEAFKKAGLSAKVLGWDDPSADWSQAPLALLRSCWNYPSKPEAFRAWLTQVSKSTELINPVDVVRWNMHKGYLLELEADGLAVAPTALVRAGQTAELSALVADRGWTDVVVKPAISANSWQTKRIAPHEIAEGQKHLDALTSTRDALVQAYLPSVETYGERSIMVIDGEVMHGVRKAPRFMEHTEDASRDRVPVTADEAAFARAAVSVARSHALSTTGPPWLYARVDVAPGPSGAPMLMELELIEPSLFFRQGPETLQRYVAGVRARLAALD